MLNSLVAGIKINLAHNNEGIIMLALFFDFGNFRV